MNGQDLKLGAINTISWMVSFSSVEDTLKLIVLAASIIYTIQRIAKQAKEWNK